MLLARAERSEFLERGGLSRVLFLEVQDRRVAFGKLSLQFVDSRGEVRALGEDGVERVLRDLELKRQIVRSSLRVGARCLEFHPR